MAIESCPHCKEPIYAGTSVCPHCKKQTGQLQPKKPLQTYEQLPQKTTSNLVEYRRTCQVCGKVWHSLVRRENHIAQNMKSNYFQKGLAACTCSSSGMARAAQLTRNIEANQSDLQRLRNCPQCLSVNYKEEIIDHAN